MAIDTGRDLEVVVNIDPGDADARRFIGRMFKHMDDPDFVRFDYSLPPQVWFVDPHGILCFVGLKGRGGSFTRQYQVRLRFDYAVEVGEIGVPYSRIHSMQSRIEGLEQWVPISSVDHRVNPSEDGSTVDSVTFELRRQEPIPISRSLNAEIRPTYSFTSSPVPGQSRFQDEVRIKTRVDRARPWRDHLDVHRGVRDLVVVAGWRDFGTWDLRVSRTDDPELSLGGTDLGARWAPVSTYAVAPPSGDIATRDFLFEFDNIGGAGVGRWLRLRRRHHRGIAGMTHSIGVRGIALETAVAEAGAALEHLGFGIAVERGVSPGRGLERHLRRIAGDIVCPVPFDLDGWPKRFAEVYNTVKHPDRPDELTAIDLAEQLRQAQLTFRAWVATRIGVAKADLERNLKHDSMARPRERW